MRLLLAANAPLTGKTTSGSTLARETTGTAGCSTLAGKATGTTGCTTLARETAGTTRCSTLAREATSTTGCTTLARETTSLILTTRRRRLCYLLSSNQRIQVTFERIFKAITQTNVYLLDRTILVNQH